MGRGLVMGNGKDLDLEEDEGEEMYVGSLGLATDLFSTKTFPTAEECMEHCRDVHGLDLTVLAKRHAMDTFSFIRLVNYIRTEAPSPGFVMALSSSQKWSDAAFLRPVLPDDPLLMWDFDGQLEHARELEEDEENGFEIDISRELNDQIANPAAGLPEAAAEAEVVVPAARLHEFRQQLLDMTRQLARKEEELKEVVADMERMKVVAQGLFTTGQEELKEVVADM